jgi:stage V sporulation protein K
VDGVRSEPTPVPQPTSTPPAEVSYSVPALPSSTTTPESAVITSRGVHTATVVPENNQDVVDVIFHDVMGMGQLKRHLRTIIHTIEAGRIMQTFGISSPCKPLAHIALMGNPGTGKTDAARRIAELLHHIGYTRKKKIKEVLSRDLVSQYVGDTAIKTSKVIKEAIGGVLFIDEAYSINPELNKHAQECINELVAALENHREELVVIIAGYEKEMNIWLDTNPGLRSRFPPNQRFILPDYTLNELAIILVIQLQRRGLFLDPYLPGKLPILIKAACSDEELHHNGRGMRTLAERLHSKQIERWLPLARAGDPRVHSPPQLMQLVIEHDFDALANDIDPDPYLPDPELYKDFLQEMSGHTADTKPLPTSTTKIPSPSIINSASTSGWSYTPSSPPPPIHLPEDPVLKQFVVELFQHSMKFVDPILKQKLQNTECESITKEYLYFLYRLTKQ